MRQYIKDIFNPSIFSLLYIKYYYHGRYAIIISFTSIDAKTFLELYT